MWEISKNHIQINQISKKNADQEIMRKTKIKNIKAHINRNKIRQSHKMMCAVEENTNL